MNVIRVTDELDIGKNLIADNIIELAPHSKSHWDCIIKTVEKITRVKEKEFENERLNS